MNMIKINSDKEKELLNKGWGLGLFNGEMLPVSPSHHFPASRLGLRRDRGNRRLVGQVRRVRVEVAK